MKKNITCADLPQLVTREGWQGPKPSLHCLVCGERFSANAGDYFNLPNNYVLSHCGKPMILATEKTVLEPWEANKSC